MKRVITGLVLAAVAWAVVLEAPPWALLAVTLGICAVALQEYFRIVQRAGIQPFVAAGHAGAVLWLAVPNLDRGYLATVFVIAVLAAAVLARRPLDAVLPSAAVTAAGLLYIAGPLLWGVLLHEASRHWLLFVMLVVAVGDVSALGVGRWFGRTKLAPRTSPRKTWEGTIASLVVGTASGAWYASHFLSADIGAAEAAVLAVGINAAGQVGDLAESALKRAANMKDSGAILPGHGGVLDRIDGMLFAIPVGYGYVQLFV